MKMDKCTQLLYATKVAVAQYGVDGASTRVIAKVADVDDGHIYRFFKTRDDLLLAAYEQVTTPYFDAVISDIDFLHNRTKLHLPECARIVFHRAWSMIVDDPDFCSFAVYYYHSPNFKNAFELHRQQLKKLVDSLNWLIKDDELAAKCLYTLFTAIFDFGQQVVDGRMPNTPESEDVVFNMVYSMLLSLSGRTA